MSIGIKMVGIYKKLLFIVDIKKKTKYWLNS